MAAASTWRSVGSGSLSPSMRGLVSGDEAVRDGAIDQLTQAGELLLRDVRAVARQASEGLVEDVLGPFCLYQAGPADADAGIQEYGEHQRTYPCRLSSPGGNRSNDAWAGRSYSPASSESATI